MDIMKFLDSPITNVSELIQKLKDNTDNLNIPVWYRGQGNIEWNLEPKLLRSHKIPPETFYLNKFRQDATMIINHIPKSEFDWLFLMQHYGIPTRLLDWSESPLVALYFAVNDSSIINDASLWVLLPTELNKHSNYRPEHEFEVPSFDDEHLQNYLPSTIARERKSSLYPMAAIAPRNSSRMQAQQGVFTISHRENIYVDEAGAVGASKDHIWRYSIPYDAKEHIRKELKLLGFSKFQLFPELESLADNLLL